VAGVGERRGPGWRPRVRQRQALELFPAEPNPDLGRARPVAAEHLLEGIADGLDPLRQRARRPNVESISYGICEAEFAGMVPVFREVNAVLEFEAAAGISVFASAGDTGSSGCSLNRNQAALPLQSAPFPATSPYITSVGGLNFTLTRANRIASEVGWNNSPIAFGAGGGGPSLVFPRPAWQAVRGALGLMREVPDVAMLADNVPGYAIYCSPPACTSPAGEVTPGWLDVGGTSAAAPLLAGGVADADQEAARHRQPPLGLINPLLYGAASASRLGVIRDVRHGNNDLGKLIFGKRLGCCYSHRGYDAVAGLGSVDVEALSRAAVRAYRHALPRRALHR
jgi:kumamolisin